MIREKRIKNNIDYIIIACCTYKRNLLLDKTIKSLLELSFPENIKTEILIIDNDKMQTAKDIVIKYQKISNIKINYVIENKIGLSCVRNKALIEAISLGATHLLFIDDDEIADKNWLVSHVDFFNKYRDISVSSGPTYKKFEKDYPKYIINNNLFKKSTTKKIGQLRNSCATGNVFFSLDIIKDYNIYFSEDFNFLGGEDGDFFARINKHGFNIAWNSNAINYEIIGDERANIQWMLNRYYKDGYSGAIVKFKDKVNLLKRIFYITEKLMLILINILIMIFSIPFGMTNFINCLGITLKNIGKLIGAIRLTPIIYYQKREVQNV